MKKYFVIMLAALGLIIAAPAAAQNKQMAKALKKELAQRKKAIKNNKQELFGTSRSIDVALLSHFEALDNGGDDVQEIVGYARGKSKNLLAAAAQNSVASRYAAQASAQIKGQLKQTLEGNAENVDEEVDKFSAIYLTKVESEIKGQIKPSYSLISTGADGVYELESYYIVNQTKATNARKAAFDAARKETGITIPDEKAQVIINQTVVVEQQ
ncbi:MAG: hypothetical protein J5545_00740 [Bacteroidaceae bacterium]|nr:hypothetical protein [Bacteroidaceae bacterium]